VGSALAIRPIGDDALHQRARRGELRRLALRNAGMQITAREGEPFESVLKRFTRGVQASGVLREFRVSQRFRSRADREREKRRRAARNRRKKG